MNNSNKEIIREYIVTANGEPLVAKPTMKEAKEYINGLSRIGVLPEVVELIKKVTVRTVLNTYLNNKVKAVIANTLDEGME